MEHKPIINEELRKKVENLRDKLEKWWNLPEEELRRRGTSEALIQKILARKKLRPTDGTETP